MLPTPTSERFVYRIVSTSNGCQYIGFTTNGLRRLKDHVRHLRAGSHYNRALQEDWNQFGECAFRFDILGEFKSDRAAERAEKSMISLLYRECPALIYNRPPSVCDAAGYRSLPRRRCPATTMYGKQCTMPARVGGFCTKHGGRMPLELDVAA